MTSLIQKNKHNTRHATLYAVKTNKIIRPTVCSKCNSTNKIYSHHEDYSKPLEVIWLCSKCHGERHREINSLKRKPKLLKSWQISMLMSELGHKGGKARFKKLSPERRSEIAKLAGIASGLARRNKKNDEYREMVKNVLNNKVVKNCLVKIK